MKRTTLVLASLWIVGSAMASDLFSFKPTLLHPDSGPAFVPAARIASSYKREWDLGRPDRFSLVEYAFAGTLSLKPKLDDEKTSLDVRGGLRWDLDGVPTPTQVFPGRSDGSPSSNVSSPSSGLRWGSIACELASAFEGNESMDNKQWAYGIRVNYTPAFDRDPSQFWVPYLWFDYRRISEVSTELTAKIGVPAQDYWRFGSEVYWQIPLSSLVGGAGISKSIKIVPGFQYYQSTDRQLSVGDLNDAYYYSVALDYSVPQSSGLGKKVSAVRIAISKGRIPPATTSRTTVSLAFAVRWDQFFH